MAKTAKRNVQTAYNDPPESLKGHPFYGLILDDEQIILRDSIWDKSKDIIFVNARAGSGKTLISVATANLLVQYGRYEKIIYICSPCGNESRMGYLPGNLTEKAEVYYEPLYSAIQTLGINPFTAISDNSLVSQKYGEGGYIKPLTDVYLRGCNLDNAIIICDESQNFAFDIFKKVLTRVCENTKVICIGHSAQTDLVHKEQSGFERYIAHFENKHDTRVAVCKLSTTHRSWIAEWADELN